MTGSRKISFVLNATVLLMELIALVLSAINHGFALFQFYTEDSNLFALVSCSLYCAFLLTHQKQEEIPRWIHLLKYTAACCLTVTFVVVVFVLAPMGGLGGYYAMMLQGSMLFHHFLCPVLVVLSFIFFEHEPRLRRGDLIYPVMLTAVYAAVTVLFNILKLMNGPYPFLKVYEQPVFLSVIWCVVILGGATLFAWGIRILSERVGA